MVVPTVLLLYSMHSAAVVSSKAGSCGEETPNTKGTSEGLVLLMLVVMVERIEKVERVLMVRMIRDRLQVVLPLPRELYSIASGGSYVLMIMIKALAP